MNVEPGALATNAAWSSSQIMIIIVCGGTWCDAIGCGGTDEEHIKLHRALHKQSLLKYVSVRSCSA